MCSPYVIAKYDRVEYGSYSPAAAAWAFAFWGGDFLLFLMRTDDADTTFYRVDGKTGVMSVALSGTGRRIVGAGVSTCAPVELL